MQKITENVYVENETSMCNCGIVVTGDGVVIIDTPMVPVNAKKLAAEVEKFGPIRYVINSEPHPDHIAGNCYMGGTLVAQDGARGMIRETQVESITGMLQMMSPESLPLDSEFRFRTPDITFSDKLTLYLGGHTFNLIHMPGHTPYSLAVHVPEERIVFTSDNINLNMAVFRDAIPDKWLESLKKYRELDVDKVIPGHGAVCDKSCFTQMSNIIQSWLDVVGDAIKKGLSLEQTLEEVPKAEMFKQMGGESPVPGFLNMNIERLYEILKK
jgi:cyclase